MRRIRRSGDFFNAVVARMQAAAAIQVVGATALAFGNMLRIELADGCTKGRHDDRSAPARLLGTHGHDRGCLRSRVCLGIWFRIVE